MNNLVRPILEKAVNDMKKNPDNVIFYDFNKNNVISTQQVGVFYGRVCEKVGLAYCGQHSLRHTFATRCIEAGVKPIVLKKWLGHTNIHITLDTYADVLDRLNDDSIGIYETYIVE